MNQKIINEGAEAKIVELKSNTLKKIREKKPYRLEVIDKKLRKFRNKREFKVLTKLYENKINVPKPISIDEKEISFQMEKISGEVLKNEINKELLSKAFNNIIKIHQLNIVHGDLTTLNMILSGNKIFLLDFGLSEFSQKIEDKAVDLNLFFTCIKNEHPKLYQFKDKLLKKYSNDVDKGKNIVNRLEKIEHRGRNK